MTIMHTLLASALRFTGRHKEAAAVEAAGSDAPPPRPEPVFEEIPLPPPPAHQPAVVQGDPTDFRHGAPAPSAGPSAGRSAGSAPSLGSSGSSGSGGGAGAPGADMSSGSGGGGRSSAGSGKEVSAAHPDAHPDAHDKHTDTHHKPFDRDDPLAGLRSERLKEKVSSDAFKSASASAQDTAIGEEARMLLPEFMRPMFKPERDLGPGPIDISKEARQARIDALHGEIPQWAKNTDLDPAMHAKAAPTHAKARTQERTQEHTQEHATPAHQPAAAAPGRQRDDGFDR